MKDPAVCEAISNGHGIFMLVPAATVRDCVIWPFSPTVTPDRFVRNGEDNKDVKPRVVHRSPYIYFTGVENSGEIYRGDEGCTNNRRLKWDLLSQMTSA